MLDRNSASVQIVVAELISHQDLEAHDHLHRLVYAEIHRLRLDQRDPEHVYVFLEYL